MAVLQDSNDAIIVYDLDATILGWNGGAERLYGHPRDTVVATSLYALLPPAARTATQDLVKRVLATGKASTEDAQRLRWDGTPVSVSITVSALRNASGAIYALISTKRDITLLLRLHRPAARSTPGRRLAAVRPPRGSPAVSGRICRSRVPTGAGRDRNPAAPRRWRVPLDALGQRPAL